MKCCKFALLGVLFLYTFIFAASGWAQSSGTIAGVVKDATGGVLTNATVEISDVVSGYHRETTTGTAGDFRFTNIPFNTYHMVVKAPGFSNYVQDVDVRSSVPATVDASLKVGTTSENITVEASGADLVETESTPHTDVDRELFDKLPLESASSSLSSLVTLASPGVVADSNGLFHGLGDHAENSFSVDGQPVTDQQSKVFSNQLPVDSIQSMEVISGAPPAEYGDKTSLVIKVTTRSGLGQTQPAGSVTTSYGSFGSATVGGNFAIGGTKWGNFISLNGLNTGRFLDPPEFVVMHSKGNEENFFDRFDLQPTMADSFHINLGYTRSWFQEPNSFDAQAIGQDQRAQVQSLNVAPSWTHLFNATTLLTAGAFVRRDVFNYYPSANPLSDISNTASQHRILLNAGIHTDVSYVKGANNVKIGATFQHTLLTENFSTGLTDPTINDPCLAPGSNPDGSDGPAGETSVTSPSGCAAVSLIPNNGTDPNAGPLASPVSPFDPILGCLDLTRPTVACTGTRGLFTFNGHGDVKELGLYVQDTITKGAWSFNVGIRGDIYRGIGINAQQPQPRVGIAYNIKKTNTVLRISYARVMETPFNENLVLASTVGNPVATALFGATAPIAPGQRNEFHAGFEQAFGKYLVVDADYLWKYTHNGYDFSDFLNTPIFFPVAWDRSKIHGPSVRVSMPGFHGVTAFFTASSVAARFFAPQVGGLGTDLTGVGAFRIDHDQKFQQTTHIQYQPFKDLPWIALNWRYDNGLVAGAVPCFNDTNPNTTCAATSFRIGGVPFVDLSGLSFDQQAQAGLTCNGVAATSSAGFASCAASQYGSTLLKIPAPGTSDDDHNPSRVAPRNLFDLSLGDDNLFRKDRYKWSLRLTAINVTNKVALYNFLSTFSGTHYVTPRSLTAELGFHF
ncbi:MAG TPA: TonB-dependent receptor [Candidatus Acidoferrales bacterium]|nr:TonB-dependent receptor [Candidatus Acidoferrales bacterium]